MYLENTEVILDYMKEHNYTKKEFAKLCGINLSALETILKKKNSILHMYILKVAKVLNMDLSAKLLKDKEINGCC